MRPSVVAVLAAALLADAAAGADQVVEYETGPRVAEILSSFGLTDLRDVSADPQFPSMAATRPDGFTVQATFFACAPDGCRGLDLSVVIPAREMRFARIIESSIERHAIGFDAWIDDTNALPAILIHTYLTYDGGVSSRLLPSTVNQFLSMIDQTKAFMISDDPKVVEIWHKPPGR